MLGKADSGAAVVDQAKGLRNLPPQTVHREDARVEGSPAAAPAISVAILGLVPEPAEIPEGEVGALLAACGAPNFTMPGEDGRDRSPPSRVPVEHKLRSVAATISPRRMSR